MKTNTKLIVLALLALIPSLRCWSQPLELEHKQKTGQLLQLKCVDYDVDSVPIEAVWTYDMLTQELTLDLNVKRIDYDVVWLPMRHYERKEVKQYIRHKMNGRYRTRRPFRRQAFFGFDCVFRCNNCELIDEGINSMEQEMVANGTTATFRFHVTDPKNVVNITFRGAVPVSLMETAMGIMKYRFQFVSDPIPLRLKVPSDPCLLPQSIVLLDSAQALYREMDEAFERLAQTIGRKDRKGCQECMVDFEKRYSVRLAALQAAYDAMPAKCSKVGNKLASAKEILNDANSMKCPPPPPDIGCTLGGRDKPSKVAKYINSETKKLERCTNAIRSKRKAAEARTNGQKIISQMDETISQLKDSSKKDNSVAKAIRMYELARDSFNLTLKYQ